MKSLKLFRASAGSGKTFTLTVEYIKLLIKNQQEYRNTLAVTFTNKATTEMKERILGTLYGLKMGLKSSENYFRKIKSDPEITCLNLSDQEIQRRAGLALKNLTHDYSRFRIETIDSFFLSILRDLAREMDLTANRSIDMNNEDVLDEAVDNLIDGLDEKSGVLTNLTHFIDEKIEDDKRPKIKEELKDFGKNVFNEKYMEKSDLIADQLKDSSFLPHYKKTLTMLKSQVEGEMKERADRFMDICKKNGWEAKDFYQANKGVYNFFRLIAEENYELKRNTYVDNALTDDLKYWSKNNAIRNEVEGVLRPLLREVIDNSERVKMVSNSVSAILSHLNHMMLLGEISEKVKDLNYEANRFLLSNTSILLQRMIDGSSVPFIYEKTGSRLSHIMIDEFQDTSALQWSNFLPLLVNSLDEGEMCLIVGDVKQSIYRWRNSDWQILNGINQDRYFNSRILPQPPLDFNRRSLGNIITFNNLVFANAIRLMNEEYRKSHGGKDSESMLHAYSDVQQKLLAHKKGRGYVKVEMLTESNNEEEKFNYNDRTYDRVVEIVEDLVGKGTSQKDICILIRTNKHIPILTEKFAQKANGIRLVSNEAYRLDASLSVNIIISAIRFLLHPDDRLNLFRLVRLIKDNDDAELFTMPSDELMKCLPDEFVEKKDTLIYEPLKELIEKIYVVFNLHDIKGQDAYMFYFHDKVMEFTESLNTDLENFIVQWDNTLHKKTIPSGGSDGVNVMSIHKSKGLEFKVIIVPFCDWSVSGGASDLLWCTPEGAPYDEMKFTAINYGQKLAESIFAADYDDENLRFVVDNLNLLYVAFTRAEEKLYILTKEYKKKDDANYGDVGQILIDALPGVMVKDVVSGVGTTWELSPGPAADEANEEFIGVSDELALVEIPLSDEENVIDAPYDEEKVTFGSEGTLPEMKQSNKSKDWQRSIMSDTDVEAVMRPVTRGILYHTVFQNLTVADDLDRVLDRMFMDGDFSSVLEKEEVERDVRKALADKLAGRWFTADWTVINERNILYKDSEGKWQECRPDRVIVRGDEAIVIDYKTGRYNEEHKQQVATYMSHLTRMGYKDVKGYVWYIMWGKTFKV